MSIWTKLVRPGHLAELQQGGGQKRDGFENLSPAEKKLVADIEPLTLYTILERDISEPLMSFFCRHNIAPNTSSYKTGLLKHLIHVQKHENIRRVLPACTDVSDHVLKESLLDSNLSEKNAPFLAQQLLTSKDKTYKEQLLHRILSGQRTTALKAVTPHLDAALIDKVAKETLLHTATENMPQAVAEFIAENVIHQQKDKEKIELLKELIAKGKWRAIVAVKHISNSKNVANAFLTSLHDPEVTKETASFICETYLANNTPSIQATHLATAAKNHNHVALAAIIEHAPPASVPEHHPLGERKEQMTAYMRLAAHDEKTWKVLADWNSKIGEREGALTQAEMASIAIEEGSRAAASSCYPWKRAEETSAIHSAMLCAAIRRKDEDGVPDTGTITFVLSHFPHPERLDKTKANKQDRDTLNQALVKTVGCHIDKLNLLLDAGADVCFNNGEALRNAVLTGNPLDDDGKHLNALNNVEAIDRLAPLIAAKNPDILKRLIKYIPRDEKLSGIINTLNDAIKDAPTPTRTIPSPSTALNAAAEKTAPAIAAPTTPSPPPSQSIVIPTPPPVSIAPEAPTPDTVPAPTSTLRAPPRSSGRNGPQ